MKKIYTWKNRFHGTTKKSTLASDEEVFLIRYKLRHGELMSGSPDARKLKRLESGLCPHKSGNCLCFGMSGVEG
jgi:hypothetical protein